MSACGGPGAGARGDVTITQGGMMEGVLVLVGTGGRIRGSGTVLALQGVHLFGGSVSPGVTVLTPSARASAVAPAAHTPGALTIQGNLTISSTAEIILHALGATPDLQDQLVVSGTANLGGRLTLNFGNGYAPKQGDRLPLLAASALTGAVGEVVITGLASGFQHRLDATGGSLTLVALNDGVPISESAGRSIFLPLVMRPSW